jgi:hypothetical protein
MQKMKVWLVISVVWCFASAALLLSLQYRLVGLLSRAGVAINDFWISSPGYLRKKYADWCEQHGIDPTPELRRIRWAKLSLMLAFVVVIFVGLHNADPNAPRH